MIEIDVSLNRSGNFFDSIERLINPPKKTVYWDRPPEMRSLYTYNHTELGAVIQHNKRCPQTLIRHIESADRASRFVVLDLSCGEQKVATRYRNESWLATFFVDRLQYHLLNEISGVSMRPSRWLAEHKWCRGLNRYTTGDLIAHQGVYAFNCQRDTKRKELGDECLGNDYTAPFTAEGMQFQSVTHFLTHKKLEMFSGQKIAKKILQIADPAELDREAKALTSFSWQEWVAVEREFATEATYKKFCKSQHWPLKRHLLSTEETILVYADSDQHWGAGLSKSAVRHASAADWNGENMLGYVLTEVRAMLKQDISPPPLRRPGANRSRN